MSARRIDKEQLEGVSSHRPDACTQGNTVGDLFPNGVDVDHPNSAAAWNTARRHNLDLVFAACSIAMAEVLGEFRAFCLQQLGDLLPSNQHPAMIMGAERPASWLYRCAEWHLIYAAKPVTGDNCFSVAVAARKASRGLRGKDASQAVREAQLDWWGRRHRRLLAGEKPPILGEL